MQEKRARPRGYARKALPPCVKMILHLRDDALGDYCGHGQGLGLAARKLFLQIFRETEHPDTTVGVFCFAKYVEDASIAMAAWLLPLPLSPDTTTQRLFASAASDVALPTGASAVMWRSTCTCRICR